MVESTCPQNLESIAASISLSYCQIFLPTCNRSLRPLAVFNLAFPQHALALLNLSQQLPHFKELVLGSHSNLDWPSHLASVTDLTLRGDQYQKLCIPFSMARRLKRLSFHGETLTIDSVDVFRPEASLKHYFPALQSLSTICYTLSDLNQLRNLPSTLTELVVRFNFDSSSTTPLNLMIAAVVGRTWSQDSIIHQTISMAAGMTVIYGDGFLQTARL